MESELIEIEKENILRLLINERFSTVLDIGCGTGVWSRMVTRFKPNASVLGVDISPLMIEEARSRSGHRHEYLVHDCKKPLDIAPCDLILCAMSADYIGFGNVARLVSRGLSREGKALVWVRDPANYEIASGKYIKKWNVFGRRVVESACAFDNAGAIASFR
ncbi:class I SAM-dependent DNA methyltransferase, partial [Rhodoplanes sp. SY1]|uniref:class I SAM-dependent DNA methyltransferase n=1 Tax=Rhodoplanes sp. SY1 TaxID=3166646 RepID=UPI0038B6A5F7